MSVSIRVHASMTVLQCKVALKRLDARVHASRVSLHADGGGGGELSDDAPLGQYGLGPDAPNAPAVLLLFFLAPDDETSSANRAVTPPPDAEFNYDAVPPHEIFPVGVVFANTPATAKKPVRRSDLADEHHAATAPPAADSHPRPASRRDSPHHVIPTGSSGSRRASTERSLSRRASRRASGGRPTRPSSGATGGDFSETADTSRRFLEDDGDIASQSSDGDDAPRPVQARHVPPPPNAARMQEQVRAYGQPSPRPQEPPQPHVVDSTVSAIPPPASLPGFVKGDLLDGYRLLLTAKVDLPEEVSRAILSGCNPPLVDAVPEHLAEFANLTYLDVSGNNLPFDRLRLLPRLDELNLSCNRLRDFDFGPIAGIHYAPGDVEAARGEYALEEMIGFGSLEKLDLSFNYLSQGALEILSVLPRLASLSLASNDLARVPRDLGNFWKLTRLSLRDNRLGSGTVRDKRRAARALASPEDAFLKHRPSRRRQREDARPSSAVSEAVSEEEKEEDHREHAKEWRLFQSLGTLPNLVELDLSENLLTCVPAGCIGDGPECFARLKFLNLAANQLATEASILPVGDLQHLAWLDLRDNPLVTQRGIAPRGARHRGASARVDWSRLLPEVHAVLVQTCRVSVVLERPRHNNQALQQDIGHMMRPPAERPGSSSNTAAFTGRLSSVHPVESEAASHRERLSSAKLRAFDAHQAARIAAAAQQQHQSALIEDGDENSDEDDDADPSDSLQRFIGERARLSESPAAHTKEEDDPYADQYDAYGDTFLTGMRAEALEQAVLFRDADADVPVRGGGRGHHQATTSDALEVRPIATASIVQHRPKQLLAKALSTHAAVALRSLLATSNAPVVEAAAPSRRYEAPRSNATAAGVNRPPPSTRSKRDFTTNAPPSTVGVYGRRAPKVAQVYANMTRVLDALESASLGGPSTAASSHGGAHAPPAYTTKRIARKPDVRGVLSSAYVDPVHARAQDRVRAARHAEKERRDVDALMRTVKEVSKATL